MKYEFTLDELGRTVCAEGDLTLEKGNRDLRAQVEAGGEWRRDTDEGGHLIGTRFGGEGGEENLVAEDINLNRSGYKCLENEWESEIQSGSDIHIKIEPLYQEVSERPYCITGEYDVASENGDERKEYFSFTNENLNSDEFDITEYDEEIDQDVD